MILLGEYATATTLYTDRRYETCSLWFLEIPDYR